MAFSGRGVPLRSPLFAKWGWGWYNRAAIRGENGVRQDMDTRFRWTLTTMVAVEALIVAALKLLP